MPRRVLRPFSRDRVEPELLADHAGRIHQPQGALSAIGGNLFLETSASARQCGDATEDGLGQFSGKDTSENSSVDLSRGHVS